MGTSGAVETAAREHGPALVGYAYLLTGTPATVQAYLRQCVLNGIRDGSRRRV